MERYVIRVLSTLKPSTLNLFNRVVHFDDASGFNGYIESVEISKVKTLRCMEMQLL